MPPPPSQPRNTLNTLIHAFNTMDIDTIISLRTPSCTRVILPSTLNFPPQSNSTYRAQLLSMKSLFTSFSLTIHDIIEGTSESVSPEEESGKECTKIVAFVSARGDTPVGEYRNEYVWKMGFEEGGKRVSEWVEYVDVGMVRDFAPLLRGEIGRRKEEEGVGKGEERAEEKREKGEENS